MDQLESWRVGGCEDERCSKEASDEWSCDPTLLLKGKREKQENVETCSKDEEDGKVQGILNWYLSGVVLTEHTRCDREGLG